MLHLGRICRTSDESGQTLVEYSLILAFVAVLCISALTLVGQQVADLLNAVATAI